MLSYAQRVALLGRGEKTALIRLSGQHVAEDAALGDFVGTLTVVNASGTPTFTLEDNAGGLFALDDVVLEVNGALDYGLATFHTIEVSVSGVTPAPANRQFTIYVSEVDEPVASGMRALLIAVLADDPF